MSNSVHHHHKKISLYILILFIAGAYSAAYSQQGAVVLKLNLKKDETYTLTTTMESTTSIDIPGMAMEIDQIISMDNEYFVETVDRNNTSMVRVTYNKIQFQADMGGASGAFTPIKYDSKRKTNPDNPVSKMFDAIEGKSFTMNIASNGRISEVQGLKEILSHAASSMNPAYSQLVQSFMSEQSMQRLLTSAFDIFPDNPVNIGDSWNKASEVTLGYPMSLNTIYTLRSRSNGLSTVAVDGTLHSRPGTMIPALEGLSMSVNMTGTQTGSLTISEATGLIRIGTVAQRISGTMEMENPGNPAEIFSIPLEVSATLQYTSK